MEAFALIVGVVVGCMFAIGESMRHDEEQKGICKAIYRVSECEKIYVPIYYEEEPTK